MTKPSLGKLARRAHSHDREKRKRARAEIAERFPVFARLICDGEWYLTDDSSCRLDVRTPSIDFAQRRLRTNETMGDRGRFDAFSMYASKDHNGEPVLVLCGIDPWYKCRIRACRGEYYLVVKGENSYRKARYTAVKK